MKFSSLAEAAERGKLNRLLEQYLKTCRPPEDSPRKSGRFPNLAGFCRWFGCGTDEVDQLRITHPEAAGYLIAVMEDEALNSPILSPTVVSAYLKRRLSYAERGTANDSSLADCGEVRLVFEHDVVEDGS